MEAAEVRKLKEIADAARFLYNTNQITREECQDKVMPFIEAFNEFSKQTAKKYRVPVKLINFQSYIR